jgi:hypothetical protein
MQPGLRELTDELTQAASLASLAAAAESGAQLREASRRVLSAGSKLHARAALLEELAEEAQFVASVDRAIARSKEPFPRPIPGDTPLPLPTSPPPGRPGRKPPRSPKGQG